MHWLTSERDNSKYNSKYKNVKYDKSIAHTGVNALALGFNLDNGRRVRVEVVEAAVEGVEEAAAVEAVAEEVEVVEGAAVAGAAEVEEGAEVEVVEGAVDEVAAEGIVAAGLAASACVASVVYHR